MISVNDKWHFNTSDCSLIVHVCFVSLPEFSFWICQC